MARATRHILLLLAALTFTGAPGHPAAGAQPPTDGTVHAGTACNDCHLLSGAARARPSAAVARRCTGCHDTRPVASGPFHAARRTDCLTCHCYHEPERLVAGGSTLDLASLRKIPAAHCLSCHADPGPAAISPTHAAAAGHYHGDAGVLVGQGPSAGCVNCHAREVRSTWQVSRTERSRDFYLHASHPQGMRVVPGSGRGASRIRPVLDPAVPLYDGRIECQTCHQLTAGTRHLVRPFARRDGLCLGCHRVGPEPAPGVTAVAGLAAVP